jgi:hypothetical protein
MVAADGPRQAGEPSAHSPAADRARIVFSLLISEGLAGLSLPRLRQDALSSTSALARRGGPSPHCIPIVNPARLFSRLRGDSRRGLDGCHSGAPPISACPRSAV